MSAFSWIMSYGGPLICLETVSAGSWGGIERLSVGGSSAATDYDRACEGLPRWLTSAPLQNGSALFFQGPFDTSFWQRAPDGKLFVVRIEACEVGTDFETIMSEQNEAIFENQVESLHFKFKNPDLMLFDATETGADARKKVVLQKIDVGTYNIATAYFENKECSLLLHRFDRET